MKTQFTKLFGLALAAGMAVITGMGCSDSSVSAPQTPNEPVPQSVSPDMKPYDYVFRVVNITENVTARFADQIETHNADLQKLASYFVSPAANSRTSESAGKTIRDLAQEAFTAYSTPEIRELVMGLAADGVYIQFAYKQFLVDQCVVADAAVRSGAEPAGLSVEAYVFDGKSADAAKWPLQKTVVKGVPTNTARSFEDEDASMVTLAFPEEHSELIEEYFTQYSEILMSAPDALIEEQDDGSLLVTNGDLQTTIEFDQAADAAGRGIWSSIKKVVSKVVPKITGGLIVTGIINVVAFASGAGWIALPAGLVVKGGAAASVSYLFYL